MFMIDQWQLFKKTFPFETVSPLEKDFRVSGILKKYYDIPVSFVGKPFECKDGDEIATTSIVKIICENNNLFFVTKDNLYFVIGDVNQDYEKIYQNELDELLDHFKEQGKYEIKWSVPFIEWDQEFASSIIETLDWYDGYLAFLTCYKNEIYYFVLADGFWETRTFKGFKITEDVKNKILNQNGDDAIFLYKPLEDYLLENGMMISAYTIW